MKNLDETGNCTICGKKDWLGEIFYQDKDSNRITLSVCKLCLAKDLMGSLRDAMADSHKQFGKE